MEIEIKVFGNPEEGAMEQAKMCLQEAEAFILMADNHKGYNMPIGGVAVYKDKISPAGVGFDIACGNKAVKLGIKYEEIKGRLEEIAEEVWRNLEFGIGKKNQTEVGHDLFNSPVWNELSFYRDNPGIKQTARNQLGTIGSGNHYVDIFKDEEDFIWVGVHFGSRGLGHKTATEYIKRAGANPNGNMDEAPALLDVHSTDGQEYIKAMTLAGQYAYAGRDWVCDLVRVIIGADIVEEVHNHHNFAWKEEHFGEEFWVVRKGATPAFPGQRGFVGGSMGDNAVIVEGVDDEKSKSAFYSTVHGAGRVMSRTKAAGKVKMRKVWQCGQRDCHTHIPFNEGKYGEDGSNPKCPKCNSKMHKQFLKEQVAEGLVDMEAVRKDIQTKGIILKGAGADESPQVYKRLPDVLEYHAGTIKVLHTLTPLIVCMAGADEFDPYKD